MPVRVEIHSFVLTRWGRVTHICASKLTIIVPDNGLSPGRRQAIIWTNAGILLIGPLETNFSDIFIEIHTFSFKEMHLKMSSAKWRKFCLGLNMLSVRGHKLGKHINRKCTETLFLSDAGIEITTFRLRHHRKRPALYICGAPQQYLYDTFLIIKPKYKCKNWNHCEFKCKRTRIELIASLILVIKIICGAHISYFNGPFYHVGPIKISTTFAHADTTWADVKFAHLWTSFQ